MQQSAAPVRADSADIVWSRKSLRARLWLGGLAVALFVATLVGANGFAAPSQPSGLRRVGHDFLPFYVAGSLVREGRAHEMYDLDVVRDRERRVARENGLPLGAGFGPFWNPPFYALPFVPLSAMPYRAALLTWLGINLAALVGAVALLCRIVMQAGPSSPGYAGVAAQRQRVRVTEKGSRGTSAHPFDLETPHPGPLPRVRGRGSARDWRSWGLVPLLVLASTPFLMALTHGQNTFCSLLLLTAAVVAWRGRRAVLTGLLLGVLSYKPQLAALVGLVALIDLGWRVALGAIVSGGLLLLASVVATPGVLETYLDAMPRMLRFMQVEQPYMWERHATLRAFWRLLLQGRGAGEASGATNVLTLASAGPFVVGLLTAAVRSRGARGDAARHDRLIAAAVAAMPLVMPFYFDYDLLLLAVPVALYAVDRSRSASAMRGADEAGDADEGLGLTGQRGAAASRVSEGPRCSAARRAPEGSAGSTALRRGVAQRSRGIAARLARSLPDRCLVPALCALYVWLTVNPDVALRTNVNLAVPLLAGVAGGLLARALRRGPETAQCVVVLEEPPAPPPAPLAAAA